MQITEGKIFDKETAMSPVYSDGDLTCPRCGIPVYGFNYCRDCGQRLLWDGKNSRAREKAIIDAGIRRSREGEHLTDRE